MRLTCLIEKEEVKHKMRAGEGKAETIGGEKQGGVYSISARGGRSVFRRPACGEN